MRIAGQKQLKLFRKILALITETSQRHLVANAPRQLRLLFLASSDPNGVVACHWLFPLLIICY